MAATPPIDPGAPAPTDVPTPAGSDGQLSLRAARGFLWMLSTGAAQGVVQLLTLIVLARLLGPTAFGIVGGALVVMRVAEIVSKLGVGHALVQRKEIDDRHTAAALIFFLGWGAIVTAGLIAAAPQLAALIGIAEVAAVVPLMAMGVLASNFSEVSLALLRRELRFRALALAQASSYMVAYGIVGVALALLGFGLWSLAWSYVCQLTLKSAVLLGMCRHRWSFRAPPTVIRELLTFGGGMTGWRLATRASKELDNLVVARMLGAEALGLYRRAYQLSVTPADFFARSMATIVFPVASKLHETERLARAYLLGVAGVSLFGLPVGAFMAVVAPELVLTLLGPDWAAAGPALAVLSLGLIFHLNQQVVGSIAAATGAVYRTAWRHMILALAVLIGALIGQIWGLTGVALGVLAALMLHYLLMIQLAASLTGLSRRAMLLAHGPAALLMLIVAGSAALARHLSLLLDLGAPAVLLVCVTVAGMAGFVVLRAWPSRVLGASGLWWLERLLKALPRRHARLVARVLGSPRGQGVAAATQS